jgi:hypothetical protein
MYGFNVPMRPALSRFFLLFWPLWLCRLLLLLFDVDAESFGTYIAPVTGIAGTVVGYWFGTVDRPETSK